MTFNDLFGLDLEQVLEQKEEKVFNVDTKGTSL